MITKKDKNIGRIMRHKRIRGKISGTPERPRLAVYRSNSNIYAQIIDDAAGKTLVSANSIEKDFEGSGGNKAAARKVGNLIAKRAIEKLYSTAADIFTMDVYKSLQKAPVKADSNSNGG